MEPSGHASDLHGRGRIAGGASDTRPRGPPASLLDAYVLFEIEFDERPVHAPGLTSLPPDWRGPSSLLASQTIGDEWLKGRFSAVLRVPSAVIPIEYSCVLNPGHPDHNPIGIGDPLPFGFDRRLVRP